MNTKELARYLSIGSGGVCIDRSSMIECPERVREINILAGNRVIIEFNVYDQDEGGPRYLYSYGSLEELVEGMEVYLGKPIVEWHNYSRSGRYPDEPTGWVGKPSDQDNARFSDAVFSKRVHLPARPFVQQVAYWQTNEKDVVK